MAGRVFRKTEVQAYAKINFSLDIKGTDSRRYHVLESIMQTVGISDVVTVTSVAKGGTPPKNYVVPYKIPVSVTSDMRDLPTDSRNTAYRAAEIMCRKFPVILAGNEDIAVNIKKRIPVGGGLGGSSADCAAVIKAFNIHFGLGLSTREMMEIGSGIGSDVPFMIQGGTALVCGTGDEITKLQAPRGMSLLICYPGFGMDTWEVYRRYDEMTVPDEDRPDTEALVAALERGENASFVSGLKNVLEAPAFSLKKELSGIKEKLGQCGCEKVLMSGSGSSFFCVFNKESEAKNAMRKLGSLGMECLFVISLSGDDLHSPV